MPIYRLKNKIQNYHWGSYNDISNLLGETKFLNSLPQAELWMGANPVAPSKIMTESGEYSLLKLIKDNPIEVLGKESVKNFGVKLPYIFKVLAVNEPLSVQVHPNREQAIFGYEKENRKQVCFDSPERNYKDRNHKFECIYALTPLWGLSGFRNIDEIQLLINEICPEIIFELFQAFKIEPNQFGLKNFLKNLMLLPKKEARIAIFQALLKMKKLKKYSLIFEWVCNLTDIYPDDMAVFAPIILNTIRLEPGEVLFIPAGVAHSYMRGFGVELAVNSENVIRGGLTCKHRDIEDFWNIADFNFQPVQILEGKKNEASEIYYKTPADEFSLSVINLKDSLSYLSSQKRNIEIILCTQGSGIVRDIEANDIINIEKGTSILITASVRRYFINGNVVLLKASVPIKNKR